jgi:hypothetical protein
MRTADAAELEPVRAFRPPRWMSGILLVFAPGLAIVTVFFYRNEGVSFNSGSAAAVTLFMIVGLADALTTRVALFSGSLIVTSNFRRRTFPREALESVTWAWGAGVSLKLKNGRWVKLPYVGNSQSVTNSIRAWLKKGNP